MILCEKPGFMGGPIAVLTVSCFLLTVVCGQAEAASLIARDLQLQPVEFAQLPASARATALASADFDEDGVPDLVVGISGDSFGVVVVYPGNLDSIYPNGPQARARRAAGMFSEQPFHPAVDVVSLALVPEMMVTGDFDNDGHWDVAITARGENRIEWLRGDGSGRLTSADPVPLPGKLTAMIEGDVNRRDGMTDLIVAVARDGAAELLVFESPLGALRGAPEIHRVPAPATELTTGFFRSLMPSIAAVAGSELVIVHGRDRRLTHAGILRATVAPARVDTIDLRAAGIAIASPRVEDGPWQDLLVLLANGDIARVSGNRPGAIPTGGPITVYTGRQHRLSPDARLVAAKCSVKPGDDLFVIDPEGSGVSFIELETGQRSVSFADISSGRFAPAAVAMRLGPSSLRSLLVAGLDDSLSLTEIVALRRGAFDVNDNNDDPDFALDGVCETASGNGVCTLRAAIQEANASTGPHTITFTGMTSGDQTIYPLSALPTLGQTMTIDGTTHVDGMVELDGTAAGAVNGITVSADSSTLHGLSVHSFRERGIRLEGDFNLVEGCHVGTDAGGTTNLGNLNHGFSIVGSNNQIGGTTPEARNIISGNKNGIYIDRVSLNTVQGNYVGTDASGSFSVQNTYSGILTRFSPTVGNLIGGTVPGAGNLVSGNGSRGLFVWDDPGTQVLGNLIGTDATGGAALPNGGPGVMFYEAIHTDVGSSALLGRNVISGNAGDGVYCNGYNPVPDALNQIQNNLIGTNSLGTDELKNFGHGISLGAWIGSNVIGGSAPGAGNVISGNLNAGVSIQNSNHNVVQGNLIGTDSAGIMPISNGGAGIWIYDASSSQIGGVGPADGNTIAHNSYDGVAIAGQSLFNSVLGNTMAFNGGLPIDLGNDGATLNDAGDPDSGANRLMNFPEILGARINPAGDLEFSYAVDSDPLNAEYDLRVELYVADGDGLDGTVRYLGFDTWTLTDYANGTATTVIGNAALLGVDDGDWIVATATDDDGNTSELPESLWLVGNWLAGSIFDDGFESGTTTRWSVTVGM